VVEGGGGGSIVAYRVLVGRLEGTRSHGRRRHTWEDNIKNASSRCGLGEWTGLIWLRIGTGSGAVANAVMNSLVP